MRATVRVLVYFVFSRRYFWNVRRGVACETDFCATFVSGDAFNGDRPWLGLPM